MKGGRISTNTIGDLYTDTHLMEDDQDESESNQPMLHRMRNFDLERNAQKQLQFNPVCL